MNSTSIRTRGLEVLHREMRQFEGSELRRRVLHSTLWILLGYSASQLIRFGGNLILTRLLLPELFGLMALVNAVVIGIGFFSDAGIGPNIIQNKRGDEPAFLNTGWTILVARGSILWLMSLALALPLARLYGEQRLLWLIPIVGLTTLIDGFNSTNLYTIARRIQVAPLAIMDLGIQALTTGLTVAWALVSPTVWALVAANLGAALIKLWWSRRLIPETRNRLTWEPTAAREIFSFGKWIFIATAMTYLAVQSDRLILGKLFSIELLGIYTIAYAFADIPRQLMIKFSSSILFPLISRQAQLPRLALKAKILDKRKMLLIASAVLLAILITYGDLIMSRLYSSRYAPAAWMMPLLALGLWHTLLYNTIGPVLMGIERPGYVALGNALTAVAMIVGLPVGFLLGGVEGAVLAVAFSDVPKYAVLALGMKREGMGMLRQDAALTGVFLGLLVIFSATRVMLGLGFPLAGIL